jgi:hypothetical protein
MACNTNSNGQRTCEGMASTCGCTVQIATAGPGQYFGEVCLAKDPKATTSVIAHSVVTVFMVNKWDLLKMCTPEQAQMFAHCAIVGDIEEDKLKEQFYRFVSSACCLGTKADDIRRTLPIIHLLH